jgi:hypothetical protein
MADSAVVDAQQALTRSLREHPLPLTWERVCSARRAAD